ncbi:MAG TPA: TetR family transcriptional regulator [Acidimicrobiales bacterium]|jgi:AcrR family transcriptional regulator|nr:TetR family transcriptional regulator [Acidimicrobiales bacterium]
MFDAEDLPQGQAARRQRVVEAALALAADGGYDAVQMRDVGREAGVALGTIYRYFSSKDHLLAAALVSWVDVLEQQISRRPPTGATTAERVADILRRAHRAMQRQPRLAEAVVTALVSADPATAVPQRQVGESMGRVLSRAMSDDLDQAFADQVIMVLTHVWYSALIIWINGSGDIAAAADDVETACHLMLDHVE